MIQSALPGGPRPAGHRGPASQKFDLTAALRARSRAPHKDEGPEFTLRAFKGRLDHRDRNREYRKGQRADERRVMDTSMQMTATVRTTLDETRILVSDETGDRLIARLPPLRSSHRWALRALLESLVLWSDCRLHVVLYVSESC